MERGYNPDQENIGKIPKTLDEFSRVELTEDKRSEYITLAKRIYGDLRRSGATPEEAFDLLFSYDTSAYNKRGEIMKELDQRDELRSENRINNNTSHQRRELLNKYNYQELLDKPEIYYYHGASANFLKSFKEKGLMARTYQNQENEYEICFWVGNQELHQTAADYLFSGFGHQGFKFRVKADTLIKLGFEISPIGDSDKAVRAVKVNPIIPPEDLEVWDPITKLWIPLLDYDIS